MTIQRFFYWKQNGRIYGPFAASQLLQKYRAGLIMPEDQVSSDKQIWQDAIPFFSGEEEIRACQIDPVIPEQKNDSSSAESHDAGSVKTPVTLVPVAEDIRFKATPAMFWRIVSALFLLTLIGGGILYFCRNDVSPDTWFASPGNSDDGTAQTSGENAKDWKTVIQENKTAVGVVLFGIQKSDGTVDFVPGGTAWAVSENKFVTNAHVVEPIYGIMKKAPLRGVKIYVAMNESRTRHEIKAIQVHPGYIARSYNDSDFALLHTDRPLQNHLRCATEETLRNLRQGDDVIYLGFPMEGLIHGNLNIDNPIATMQKGNITSISDTKYGDSGFEKNVWIRHSLPTVGGASGSPIFCSDGSVVAILYAGNMNLEFENDGVTLRKREASAAMVNFAIRIDRLKNCWDAPQIPVHKFLRGER